MLNVQDGATVSRSYPEPTFATGRLITSPSARSETRSTRKDKMAALERYGLNVAEVVMLSEQYGAAV